jgi:hypothetical protein
MSAIAIIRSAMKNEVGAKYRLGDICAREAGHVPGMINIVVNAAAKLSKLDTR